MSAENSTTKDVDYFLKAATQEYKRLNEINTKRLQKLGISINSLHPDAVNVLKSAVKIQQKCDLDELSEEKVRLWYMQKCLDDSKLRVQLHTLSAEDKKLEKELKEETDACTKLSNHIEEMEKAVNLIYSESRAKEKMAKNQTQIDLFQKNLKERALKIPDKLKISHIEERIAKLKSLRKTLQDKTRKSENEKFLEDCKNLIKRH